MKPKRIVIVEDDVLIAGYFKTTCESFGHVVAAMARDADNACRAIDATSPDYVLMDMRLLGERDGVDVAFATQPGHPEMKIVYITGSTEPSSIARIETDHPHCILTKPVSPQQIDRALQ